MLSCTACTELLLDYLYGLLDDAEAEGLRQHLAGCAACQQALAQAKVQQNLLAQAARKYQEVPLFEVPADEADVLPMVAAKQPAATLPMAVRRTSSWKRWAPMAAAAALLLAVGGVYASYQNGLDTRRNALGDARKQVETVEAKLVNLQGSVETDVKLMLAKSSAQFMQLQLIGPASYQPAAANAYRLTTNSATGQPADAKVTVKVLGKAADGKADAVIYSQELQSKGELRFTLPAKLPVAVGSTPRLVVEVGKDVIEQPLTVSDPSYVTHVAMNKSVFHGGDTLFFRTLTLDRYALTPVDRPVMLNCNLYHVVGPNLFPVKELVCTTEAGGIAGGEIVLPMNLPYGPYVLMVTQAPDGKDGSQRMAPVTRSLLVEQNGKINIAAAEKKKDVAGKKGAAPAPGGVAAISSPRMMAEFFPEGGDLIAGTTNRVYFRLQNVNGLAKNLEAAVVLAGDPKQEAVKLKLPAETVAVANQLVGHFDFTPQPGQSYRFNVTNGGKAVDGFPLPAARASGVTLTVPKTTIAAGKPLEIKVSSSQREPVLVVASCRGHIVDQKIVQTGDKAVDVALEPLPETQGVIRVTAYEKVGKDWQPAAERLVYQQPTQTLKLSANLPEKGFKPGDRVNMGITVEKETGAKADGWLHVLVIDQNALKTQEADPLTFFLLGSDLHDPQEVEDYLLPNSGAADKTIDLFLGTQGWRRFAPQQQPGAPGKLTESRGVAEAGEPSLFTAGVSADAVKAKFVATVQAQQEEIVRHANQERESLLAERETGAERARAAAATLADYEQLPTTWLRYGVGIAVAIAVFAGAVLLLVGLIVAIRAHSSPRLMLVGSFCVLLVGLVLFSATGSLRTGDASNDGSRWLAWLKPGAAFPPWQSRPEVDKTLARDDAKITNNLYAAATAPGSIRGSVQESVKSATVRAATLDLDKMKPNAALKGGGGGAGGGAKGGKGAGGFGGQPQPPISPIPLQKDGKQADPQALQGTANPQAMIGDKKAADATMTKGEPGILRQFANLTTNENKSFAQPEMLLWYPNLSATDGSASVVFDLPAKVATYRVVIYGNTADGRLGVYHGKVDAK